MSGNGNWANLSCQVTPSGETIFSSTKVGLDGVKSVVEGKETANGIVHGQLTMRDRRQRLIFSADPEGQVKGLDSLPDYSDLAKDYAGGVLRMTAAACKALRF